MISDKNAARQVSEVMLTVSGLLDGSVATMMASGCTDEEKSAYCAKVGKIMGLIGLDVLNHLYRQHADLKPAEYYLPSVSSKAK